MYWKIIIWRKKTFIAIVLLKTYPIAFFIIITHMELNFKGREKVKICKLYLKWFRSICRYPLYLWVPSWLNPLTQNHQKINYFWFLNICEENRVVFLLRALPTGGRSMLLLFQAKQGKIEMISSTSFILKFCPVWLDHQWSGSTSCRGLVLYERPF